MFTIGLVDMYDMQDIINLPSISPVQTVSGWRHSYNPPEQSGPVNIAEALYVAGSHYKSLYRALQIKSPSRQNVHQK